MDNLSELDMVYNTTNGNTIAGGFSVNSILLNDNKPAMYQGLEYEGGSKKNKKVSDRFKHLAVPAGLLYINNSINSTVIEDTSKTEVINDELYNKLLHLSENDVTIKKDKKQTRRKKSKRNIKQNNKKKTKRK